MSDTRLPLRFGKRQVVVDDLAERLAIGSFAEVVGGDPLFGAKFHIWVDEDDQLQVETLTSAFGVLVTMPNGHRCFYAALGREDASGLLADAWRLRDARREAR